MQTTDRATINQSLNRDDMVNLAPLGAVGIDRQNGFPVNPARRMDFHFPSQVVKPSRVMGVCCPPFAPRLVNGILTTLVSGLFLAGNALAVGNTLPVSLKSPCVLVGTVFADVSSRPLTVIRQRADLAQAADQMPLLVEGRATLAKAASFASLDTEWLGAAFHNKDIIAPMGDVKPGELLEQREPPISSQADQGWSEGSETRGIRLDQLCSPHERPAPARGDEIVRAIQECIEARDKSAHAITQLTTIEHRNMQLADNVTNNNALFRQLKKKGNVRPFDGGRTIIEEVMYVDSTTINVNSYSGAESLNITPNSPISSASFNICQYAGAVTLTGLEDLQNSGKWAFIDLMEGRIKVLEAQLMNRLDYDAYQDGSGNSSKNIVGLAAAVPDDPTTGSYGGIARGSAPGSTFWRSTKYSGVTDGGAAVSAANIVAYMTAAALRVVRGSNKPDLFIGDVNYYSFYVNALQSIQMVTSEGSASPGAGFASLKFFAGGIAADVVMGSGISNAVSSTQSSAGATANHMWALNTDYIYLRPHSRRNFVPIGGERQSVNQDAIVKLVGWAGNITSSGPQFSAVVIA